jgi:acetyl-CoA carboxylase biotin carboxyl carrier protein
VNLSDEDVRDILALIDGMRADRLDLRTDRFELHLRRADDGGWTQSARTLTEPVLIGDGAAGEESGSGGAAPAEPQAREDQPAEGLVAVRTPLLGTFYRAPKPGAPPFVEVGDRVTETTVVGIVETMKLMNSVYAQVTGTVAKICLANGEFAEQDAVLVLVEADTP